MSILQEEKNAYAQGHDRPIGSYLGVIGVYTGAIGAIALLARRTRRKAPAVGLGDLALMTIATHKISRMLTKDPVTSPLRVPFTRYQDVSAPAELAEEPRTDHGATRHAVGELLTCPMCMAQWVASAYAAGLAFAPGPTRLVGATMTAVAGSDWLQFGYARLQQSAEG